MHIHICMTGALDRGPYRKKILLLRSKLWNYEIFYSGRLFVPWLNFIVMCTLKHEFPSGYNAKSYCVCVYKANWNFIEFLVCLRQLKIQDFIHLQKFELFSGWISIYFISILFFRLLYIEPANAINLQHHRPKTVWYMNRNCISKHCFFLAIQLAIAFFIV